MDRLVPNKSYPLKKLAEHFGISRFSLKNACQRYVQSGGRYGLKADKPERDWMASPVNTERYLRGHDHQFPIGFESYLRSKIPR